MLDPAAKPEKTLKIKTMKSKGRIELGDVTHHNIKQMKCLNRVIFPVHYNDRFYKDVQEAGDLSKFAYYNDIVVGAVCCRIDSSEGRRRLYIMTLGCLPVYRRLGLGTLMLQHVFQLCDNDRTVESIYLHVQINNETALDFYKRFGFDVVEVAKNYYKRIEPADAYVLEKVLKEGETWTGTAAAAAASIGKQLSSQHNEKENCNGVHS